MSAKGLPSGAVTHIDVLPFVIGGKTLIVQTWKGSHQRGLILILIYDTTGIAMWTSHFNDYLTTLLSGRPCMNDRY